MQRVVAICYRSTEEKINETIMEVKNQREWELLQVFENLPITNNKIIEYCTAEKVDIIVCPKITDLTRNSYEFNRFIEKMKCYMPDIRIYLAKSKLFYDELEQPDFDSRTYVEKTVQPSREQRLFAYYLKSLELGNKNGV